MVYAKRVTIATILGVLAGIVCYLGTKSSGTIELTAAVVAGIILNRTLLGFIIGISGWRINYLLHGLIIGLIASLPMAVYADIQGFILVMIAGLVYGILIELITTKLFKTPMKI